MPSQVTASDRDRLKTLQITHILNATEDVSNFFEQEVPSLQYFRCAIKVRRPSPRVWLAGRAGPHRRPLPPPVRSHPHPRATARASQDHTAAADELRAQFAACAEFLESCRASGGRALVHCRAGVSRSATIVIAYLIHKERWDLKKALSHVDSRRFVQPNSGFIDFLLQFEIDTLGSSTMSSADFGYAPGWRAGGCPTSAGKGGGGRWGAGGASPAADAME